MRKPSSRIAGACAAHEGQQEVAEGEIDVGDFDDFHAR
jgi:hypothetical protein